MALTLHSVRESRDPDAFRGIDWPGIALSAAGLGGPVFALIEQPTHGWSDPLVWVPLIAGIACFALFVLHEARARHPMLDLALFRIRNFAVANLTTLAAYAGLIGGLFFVGLFLQQVAGYSPLEAGLATTPVSLILFVLSPRWGKLASGTGPRLPMTAGPIVGGIGLLLLLRVGAGADYLTDVLPAILVFGLGLSATVAPLTATVLDSVEERHVGIASGVNNGVSAGRRPAGDRRPRRGHLRPLRRRPRLQPGHSPTQPGGRTGSRRRQGTAAGGPEDGRARRRPSGPVGTAAADASTSAFHLGIGIAGLLMILGGIVSGFGIENPRRTSRGGAQQGRGRRPASAATAPTPTARPSRQPSPPEWDGGGVPLSNGRILKAPASLGRHFDGQRGTPPPSPELGSRLVSAPIIFSGIQPTGRKHLGNFIGAIRQYVEGQDRGDPAIFCIVDLHAISVAFDPAELRERLYDTTAILLAAGLDPERCIFFRQSDVREHTELTWLLSAVTAHGDLNRMHQFKDKSASSASWSPRRSSSTRC